MLEIIQSNRSNIANLILDPVLKPKAIIDPSSIFNPEEKKKINDDLFRYRCESIAEYDFRSLVINIKTLFPEDYQDYRGDNLLWLKMKTYYDGGVSLNFLKSGIRPDSWRYHLENLVAMRLLFPEKIKKLTPKSKNSFEVTCRQLEYFSEEPDQAFNTVNVFIRSALLYPDRLDFLTKRAKPKSEGFSKTILSRIETAKEYSSMRDLMENQLFLKLVDSEKFDQREVNKTNWNSYAQELKNTADFPTKIERLAKLKLLLADEIKFTPTGVITKTNPIISEISCTFQPIPERRNF